MPAHDRTRAQAALALLIFAVGAIVALHPLRPEFDPARKAISDYAYGPYSWLLRLALLGLAFGALLLADALRGDGPAPRGGTLPRARVLVALFGVGMLVAAIFRTVPPGGAVTFASAMHGSGAFIAFASASIGMIVFADAAREDERWRGFAALSRAGGVIALLALLSGRTLTHGALGTWERLYLGILVLWLIAVAWRLGRVGKPD